MLLRNFIAKKIGLLLNDLLKGTKVKAYYTFYNKSLTWDKNQIREYQLHKLKLLLNHAYLNVPFYRKRFEEYNLTPDSIKSIEDLAAFPILSRKDIQKNLSELVSTNYRLSKCYKGSSSGSTGRPVVYYHDKIGTSAGQAAGYFGWSLSGWKFGDKGLHIWGNPRVVNVEWKKLSSKLKTMFFNHYKFPAFKLTNEKQYEELVNILQNNNYKFLDGYTNAIYLLARYIDRNDIKLNGFDYILTTGENLQDYQRIFIEKTLGPVYDMYGCGEINGIANECRLCGDYHIIDPHVIVEFDQENTMTDDSMPLIITDLDNMVMPLIRYKIDDLGVPIKNKCRLEFSSLSKISGRINDIIDLPNGGNIAYSFTATINDDNSFYIANLKKNYKITQNEDFSEFDNLITNTETTYIVEQNSGQIDAPPSKTINGKNYLFAGWTDGNGDNPRTISPTDNTTYTALYKYPQHSNNTEGFNTNSQRKFVKTPNGRLHSVSQSMGRVWYEKSINSGVNWQLIENG